MNQPHITRLVSCPAYFWHAEENRLGTRLSPACLGRIPLVSAACYMPASAACHPPISACLCSSLPLPHAIMMVAPAACNLPAPAGCSCQPTAACHLPAPTCLPQPHITCLSRHMPLAAPATYHLPAPAACLPISAIIIPLICLCHMPLACICHISLACLCHMHMPLAIPCQNLSNFPPAISWPPDITCKSHSIIQATCQ